MDINYINFPLIILLGALLGINDTKNNRKLYIIVTILILMLEASLRSLSVGSDTFEYYNQFINIQTMSWGEIWQRFMGRYSMIGGDEYDIGYLLLQKAISLFTDNFQVFTFIAQLLFFVPLGVMLNKYSNRMPQLIWAFTFYIALLHISALGGGRQLYARGLGICAFMLFNNRKYIQSLVCIALGMTIHISLFIFLIPLTLGMLSAKHLKNIHLIVFCLVPISLIIPEQIVSFMGSSMKMDRYASYGEANAQGSAITFVLLIEMLSLFCYVALNKRLLESNRILHKMYAMAPCFTFFSPLILADGVMIRLSSYFHLFLMLLIPFCVDSMFNKQSRKIVYFILIMALALLSLRGEGVEYYFFWQMK